METHASPRLRIGPGPAARKAISSAAIACACMLVASGARAQQPEQPSEMRSPGALAAGIVLMALGTHATVVGGLVVDAGTNVHDFGCGVDWDGNGHSQPCKTHDDPDLQLAGGLVLASGGVALISGIVLTAWGGASVDVVEPNDRGQGVSVEPLVGLGSAGLRVRY